jgi:hypothetical protein
VPQLDFDIDHLSDAELTDLVIKLGRTFLSRGHLVHPLAIPGDDQQPIGFLVSLPVARGADEDAAFMAEAKRRLDNPPDRYLSVDEFLDALDDNWSRADATGRQLDSGNGHIGQVG